MFSKCWRRNETVTRSIEAKLECVQYDNIGKTSWKERFHVGSRWHVGLEEDPRRIRRLFFLVPHLISIGYHEWHQTSCKARFLKFAAYNHVMLLWEWPRLITLDMTAFEAVPKIADVYLLLLWSEKFEELQTWRMYLPTSPHTVPSSYLNSPQQSWTNR